MDLKTKIMLCISGCFVAARIFFTVPGNAEQHTTALVDSGFFLSAWLARGGMAPNAGGWSKTKATALVGVLVSGLRVFYTVPADVEANLLHVTDAIYGLVGMFSGMAMSKTAATAPVATADAQ